jgi:phosphoglycerate kinase
MDKLLKFRDFNFKGKTVAVRADLNLPYDPAEKKLSESPRLKEHIQTIKALIGQGAKTVILAHQGRRGGDDFISLELHLKLLEKRLGQEVKFISQDSGLEPIAKLKEGEVALLENVRYYDDETSQKTPEEHSKSEISKALSPYLDYFILDSFSVAHRGHASVVGFSQNVPSVAGPVFLKEYEFLREFLAGIQFSKNDVFILGGAKPDEPLGMLKELFKKRVEKILTTGVISLLFLKAKGYNLGKTENFLKEKGYLNHMDIVLEFAKEECILSPLDVAVEKDGKRVEMDIESLPVEEQILDIGQKTIELYSKAIADANIVCMKGPAGMYEKKGFETGTKKLFEAIARSECISLIGGGNSTDAMKKLDIPPEVFTYVSMSGGAFVEFMSGKVLPGIVALEESFEKFKKPAEEES